MRNLGPASWRMLARAGIFDAETLKAVGAAGAFVRVLESGGRVSMNLLYAMAAGIEGRDWRDLTAVEKGFLSREVEDLRELSPGRRAVPMTGKDKAGGLPPRQ